MITPITTGSKQQYTGVILAAGKGSRMIPFSDYYPKPVLPVGNKALVQHQVEIMRSVGITDVVVLVGHKGYEISKVLGDGSALGVRIRYVEQTAMLGIAHAVGRLEPHIHNPFLLFLGDIFFVPGDIKEMFTLLEQQDGGAVLATKNEVDPLAIRKNYALMLREDGFVSRVIEKPRYVRNRLKGVGLYLFDLSIFDAIRRTPRTAMRDEYEITDAIQIMIDDGYPVRPSNSILDDVNLTTPNDLLYCNLMYARMHPNEATGRGVTLHAGASVSNCVIGDGVVVSNPITISDSVLFPGTRVDQFTGLHHHILTPECVVDCSQALSEAQQTRICV